MNIRPLRFWLHRNAVEPAITIPSDAVESVVLRGLGHETGHAIAARHHHARVWGIAFRYMSDQHRGPMVLETLYESKDWSIETCCVVKAAGPAADLLYQGGFSDESASGDSHDIENLTGHGSLEPYLTTAKEILIKYPTQFPRITTALRKAIETEDRVLEELPDNAIGAWLLDEGQLAECFNEPSR
jgi:hypothetical protein